MQLLDLARLIVPFLPPLIGLLAALWAGKKMVEFFDRKNEMAWDYSLGRRRAYKDGEPILKADGTLDRNAKGGTQWFMGILFLVLAVVIFGVSCLAGLLAYEETRKPQADTNPPAQKFAVSTQFLKLQQVMNDLDRMEPEKEKHHKYFDDTSGVTFNIAFEDLDDEAKPKWEAAVKEETKAKYTDVQMKRVYWSISYALPIHATARVLVTAKEAGKADEATFMVSLPYEYESGGINRLISKLLPKLEGRRDVLRIGEAQKDKKPAPPPDVKTVEAVVPGP